MTHQLAPESTGTEGEGYEAVQRCYAESCTCEDAVKGWWRLMSTDREVPRNETSDWDSDILDQHADDPSNSGKFSNTSTPNH